MRNFFSVKNIMLIVTYSIILVTGIYYMTPLYRLLPLFVSVIVMILQSEANRYGYLLGSMNCFLYAVVYMGLGLYATASSALLLSFPIQLMTFINWKSHAFENTVVFKKMSLVMRLVVGFVTVLVFAVVICILRLSGSDYAIFDTANSVLGMLVSLLTLFGFVEYSYIWPFCSLASVILSCQVLMQEMSQMPYFVYSLYSFCCVIMAAVNVRKLYFLQNQKKQSVRRLTFAKR